MRPCSVPPDPVPNCTGRKLPEVQQSGSADLGSGSVEPHRVARRLEAEGPRNIMTTADPTEQRLMFDGPTAMQLHVVLEGIEPPIWQRLVVPLDFTTKQMRPVLQAPARYRPLCLVAQ